MTLSSFMKTNNLKSLLKALSKSERVSPAPFYLLQASKTQPPSLFQYILRLKYIKLYSVNHSQILSSLIIGINSPSGVPTT